MKAKVALLFNLLLFSAVLLPAPHAIASECSAADPCGTWAMVDSQGTVTNIIVCQASVCGGGTWAGQKVVPQVAPNPVTHDTTGTGGYWGTYDSETREFTVDRNGPNQSPNGNQTNSETYLETDAEGSVLSKTTLEVTTPSVAKTFKYEDTIKDAAEFDQKGQPINGWDQSFLKNKELPNDSPASLKATKEYVQGEMLKIRTENLNLMQRLTEEELTEAAQAESKTLIIENIKQFVKLLNSWIKTAQVIEK